jgi:hypothetical protein
MEITLKTEMSKEMAKMWSKKLGLEKIHVVSFGVFRPGKNQQEFENALRRYNKNICSNGLSKK